MKYFRLREFVCNCCGKNKIDRTFIKVLDAARGYSKNQDGSDIPFIITSGYRCEKLNVLVKGSPTSRHKSGLAVDIKVRVNKKILPLKVVMNHIIDAEINFDQILIENALNIIHIGFAINPLKARKQVKYAWIDKNNNWKTKKL